MPANGTVYPPLAPTVDPTQGQGGLLTVDLLLNNSPRITERLSNLILARLVAPRVFADGPRTTSGAVLYDQILANDLYTSRDVQPIAPGNEFPLVDDSEVSTNVGITVKRGGAFFLTYEAVRRNNIDILNRKLTRLTNTIVRKIDTVCMGVLDANIPAGNIITGTSWSNQTTGNPILDLTTAINAVDQIDLNYTIDTVLYNPVQALALFNRQDIRNTLPRENLGTNQLLSGLIPSGFLGIPNWIQTNRVAAGSVYLLQSKVVGSLCDELPLYTRTTDHPENETWLVQAARVCVPVITDPLAVVKLIGIS